MMDGVLSRTQKYVTFFRDVCREFFQEAIINDIPRLLKL